MSGTAKIMTGIMMAAVMFFALSAAGAEPAAGDGWIKLFNGKDLTGWQNARQPNAENKWIVEDGTMTNQPPHCNDIATVDHTFKDFDLKLEYKTVKGGNSGVYLRGREEVQVLDSTGKNPPDKHDDGAIYDQFAPKVNASKPIGEWNTLEVSYIGDTVTVKLNGQLIHDKQKIEKPTGGALPGASNDPGALMLQGDHGKVWFRNVMIKPAK